MASLDWMRYVYANLQMGGFNRGGARDAVIDLLGEQECALSAAQIETRLRGEGRPIARASIYRTLDLLVERGLAERVVVGQGEARFEPLEPSGEHHHHLYCGQCGRLIPFDDPGLERAINKLEDRLGITVDSHDVLRLRTVPVAAGAARARDSGGERDGFPADRAADRRYQASTLGRRLPGVCHQRGVASSNSVAIQRRVSTGSITSSISKYDAMLMPRPRS
jgi:Fur family ferric uptake transcriptional regulator